MFQSISSSVGMGMMDRRVVLLSVLFLCLLKTVVFGVTDPGDYAVLDDFRRGLVNPELLGWPKDNRDPCGPPKWDHVFCSDGRVTQIQVANLGLKGPLPPNFSQLSMLYNLGFQRNAFTGPLPSFNGLSKLQFAFLNSNEFDTIPLDFFDGLTRLQVMSLDGNPLNQSTGWMFPSSLRGSAQLVNLTCSKCNIVGKVPEFLGSLSSLSTLRLSYNALTGEIPESFKGLNLKSLLLNNQNGEGLTGPINFLPSMTSLTVAWLHGNSFTGTIPDNITECASLKDLVLNNNQLTGIVPASMKKMGQLQNLNLNSNLFLGSIPDLTIKAFSYKHNSFCQSKPGIPCSPQVEALLDFLGGVNYPYDLAKSWTGNDPCADSWLGISCSSKKVTVINLQNHNLTGIISPSLGKLDSLMDIRLGGNNLYGTIPANLTSLKSLKILNLTGNNIEPPIPKFSSSVQLLVDQNPLLNSPSPSGPSSPSSSTGAQPESSPSGPSLAGSPPSIPKLGESASPSKGSSTKRVATVASSVAVATLVGSLIAFFLYRNRKKTKDRFLDPNAVVHPRYASDPDNLLKVAVASNASKSVTDSDFQGQISGCINDACLLDSGSLVVSVQVLRNVTRNFAPENELGRGGFGVVYKGKLHDGTMLAVKRMEAAIVSNKALDEFHSEISVLSTVRHRNLVSLLGYSVEGNERLLVYEYMPGGPLSRHLFQWQILNLEPLSWMKRLNIALDVARGVEYLHNLAHQSFIHRDLKSSNILLGDDYRAKVSDFGLVKSAPNGNNSVATRLAGTFGYLAPEYAVTGKITTKADVFSFGVVLMEIVTGLAALDEDRPEESRHLASWFSRFKSNKEMLMAATDPVLNVSEETFDNISVVAELAGHCTAREPQQRPDMSHAVNVLSPLVEKWKPMNDDGDDYSGIDLHQPLLQMVKGWQADDEVSKTDTVSLDDSKGSIPSKPTGFAESFTSSDGR